MGMISVLFLMAVLTVFILAIVTLIVAGAGATALGAGGLASTAAIKDVSAKRCMVLAAVAVFLFALCCFALVGVVFWADMRTILAIVGCVLGAAIMALGIVGTAKATKVTKKAARILFIVLFTLVIGLSVLAIATYAIAIFLVFNV